MNSCCLVVFYFGDRRRKFPPYEKDRLCYVKKNIELLTTVKNSLNKIYFIFNVEQDHYDLLNQAIALIPKKIQGAEVEIVIRQNVGASYGAYSDVTKSKDHDYYFFNEDDIFYLQDNWDSYMIENFEKKENCGAFGCIIRPARKWNYYKEHFGGGGWVTSKEVIKNVRDKFGGFNYKLDNDYRSGEDNQINFSWDIIRAGYRLYDTRDDYQVHHALTSDQEIHKVQQTFMWNKKILCAADTIAWGMPHVWWRPFDEEFQKDFRKTYPHLNSVKNPYNKYFLQP